MINIEKLSKSFGHTTAVDNVSFKVNCGEVLGFLGPNAAGKSTTMRMITGYIRPTYGKITIGNYDVLEQPKQAKGLIGYLPECSPIYKDMTPKGFLKFVARIKGVKDIKKNIDKVVDLCGLKEVFDYPIETLSKGYVQRVSFAQAIINDPPYLILDEPTDGLDPNQKHEMRKLINGMGQNKAIIISTHILEEVDECCSRVIIISKGRLVADSTPKKIRIQSQIGNALIFTIKKTENTLNIKDLIRTALPLHNVNLVSDNEGIMAFKVRPNTQLELNKVLGQITEIINKNHIKIIEIKTDEVTLAEVFRKITLRENEK